MAGKAGTKLNHSSPSPLNFASAGGLRDDKLTVLEKAENVTRAAAGQPPLPEDEWIKLFKLPAEPSRLESLLISGKIGVSPPPIRSLFSPRQVVSSMLICVADQYCKQIDNYASSSMMKMFALKGMPVVDQ